MRVQRRTATGAAALAAAGLALTTVAAGPASADNPNSSSKMTKAVTVDGVMRHLEAFQEIADANDGNRGAGTHGHVASGEYVEKVLKKAGYKTERQWFDFVYDEVVSTSLYEVSPEARPIDHYPMSYSPSTIPGGVTAALEAPSGALGCTAADFTGFTAGHIALISRGTCSFGVKSQMAKAAGASAAIVYNNTDGALNGTLGGPAPDYAPITGVSKAEGQALLAKMASGPVSVKFDLVKVVEDRKTFNVIAETKTGRADNIVMMGAHLDSVHDGAGINDNGSGSAGILETAVQLAKVNKLNNKVRFAWWSAEELGLLGSEHYVADFVKNNPAELDKIATYLNFDMIGSPNYKIGVYDADQSTYVAPTGVPIPAGSMESEDILTDYFDSVGQPHVDTEFSGRSDYQAFIEYGVPASGLFTGAEQPKTAAEQALFGGDTGVAYDVNYHAPGDDISNINREALDINSDAIAHAAITLAQDTSTINGARSAGKSGKPHPVEDHLHEDAA